MAPRWWLQVAVGLLAACSAEDGASVDVVVSADATLRQLGRFQLSVSTLDDDREVTVRVASQEVTLDEMEVPRPWTVHVVPVRASDPGVRFYRFRAVGVMDGQENTSAQSRLVFVPGVRLTLQLRLSAACALHRCRRNQTCNAGQCGDDFVSACSLLEGNRPAYCEHEAVPDGGVPRTDASVDAGTDGQVDAGPRCIDDMHCDDGIACTRDRCDPSAGCTSVPDDGLCVAGARCDLPSHGCVGQSCGAVSDCPDDGNPCTEQRCDSGRCVYRAVTCDDGDPCTTNLCDGSNGSCRSFPAPEDTPCAAGRCCGGTCVDTSADPSSCGACGNVCGANGHCSAGVCSCDAGWQACDVAPGCESRSDSDVANCGGCGMACPAGNPSCIDGICRSCTGDGDCPEDGLPCTPPPTCMAGACVVAVQRGACAIEGQCRADGEPNPVNGCQACQAARDPRAWSPRPGQPCDDRRFCTTGDACTDAGACVGGGARSCDDGAACTIDVCDDVAGRCTNDVSTGCLIAGSCVPEGARHPMTECQECRRASNPQAWSARAGAACDDGLYCTVGEVCTSAGLCTGTPRICDDGQPCTVDACDEARDRCTSSTTTSCVIRGACVAAGERNPANPCLVCDPMVNASDWTVRVGLTCDDADPCTVSDRCRADASCRGDIRDCSDGLACTLDICTAGACSNPLMMGFCAIGGVCHPSGELSMGGCTYCFPGDPMVWTAVPDDTMCPGGFCCGGVCVGCDDNHCGTCANHCPCDCGVPGCI